MSKRELGPCVALLLLRSSASEPRAWVLCPVELSKWEGQLAWG